MATTHSRCGGVGDAHAPTEDDKAVLHPLRASVEAHLGRTLDQFELVSVATQVVAGTNYFAKVKIAQDEFVHLRVFQPLPHTKEAARLCGLQAGKSADAPIEYFAATAN